MNNYGNYDNRGPEYPAHNQSRGETRPEAANPRQYTGNYAGRHTGKLTGQIPRMEIDAHLNQAGQAYNPLDYYKGEGPGPGVAAKGRRPQAQPRPRTARPGGRPRPQAGPGRNQARPGQRPAGPKRRPRPKAGIDLGDVGLVFGNALAEIKNLFKSLFSGRPESAFRTRLSFPSWALLLVLNILMTATYRLLNLKAVIGSLAASNLEGMITMPDKGWKIFGVGVLNSSLNLILVFALLYAFMQLLQSEYKPPEVTLNTLVVATVPYTIALILLSLLTLPVKAVSTYLPDLPLMLFYLSIYAGFNEVNVERRRSVFWLMFLLMICSMLLVNYLPSLFAY